MRVVLVTQGISRVVQPLSDFLGVDLVAIIESAPRNYKPKKKALGSLLKYGLPGYAQRKGILYFLLDKANQSECIDWLQDLSPARALESKAFILIFLGRLNLLLLLQRVLFPIVTLVLHQSWPD